MKGLLYAGFLLNKGFFIAGGIATAVCTAVGILLMNLGGNSPADMLFVQSCLALLPLVPMAIYCEWLGRDLEKNIKSRFADYTLAAGISKNGFVLTELCKNLSVLAVCGVTGCLMMLIFMAVNPLMISGSLFVSMGIVAVICCTVEWLCIPLVISMKSAEKAGLMVGLLIGFGVAIPVIIVSKIWGNDESFFALILRLMGKPWLPLAMLGICAAVYALVYWAVFCRVRRGDVC
ncbi:MAG: hypothetical protein ACI4JY_06780 [Oscillospiraceae bacterium]